MLPADPMTMLAAAAPITWVVVIVSGAYFLGSINSALLLARRRGVDLRSMGSGNPGATNAGRALGRGTGRLVLLLDALKGGLAVACSRVAAPGTSGVWLAVAAGIAAVVGHCFPAFHGLRGGKGAATTLGVMLATVPLAGLAGLSVFVVVRRATGRASIGSLAGTLTGAAMAVTAERVASTTDRAWWMWGSVALNGPSAAGETLAAFVSASPICVLAILLTVLVFVRHHANISRLLRGVEPAA